MYFLVNLKVSVLIKRTFRTEFLEEFENSKRSGIASLTLVDDLYVSRFSVV